MNSVPIIDVFIRAENALTQSKEALERYRELQRERADLYISQRELQLSFVRPLPFSLALRFASALASELARSNHRRRRTRLRLIKVNP
jgi:hypothetical protein